VRARVFPVGRLDYHSAGLLLLTNDGDLALRLTHPRYGVRKTYQVKVKGDPQPMQLAALSSGVRLADGATNPAEVHILRQRDQKVWLSITLAEGKNRQVRRMFEAVGLPVEKLVRVAFGGLKLGALPPGAWRHLAPAEVAQLQRPLPPPRPARPARGRQRDERPRRAAPERNRRQRPSVAQGERARRRSRASRAARRRARARRSRAVLRRRARVR
jgi:23S rRNA pseudouridine2605 synthase